MIGIIHRFRLSSAAAGMSFGGHRLGVRPEKFFQRLRIPARDLANRIGSLAWLLAVPEVLPEMAQMIERVRIDSLLHGVGPLFICDGHIADRPSQRSPQSLNNFPHRWSFAHQRVDILSGRLGARQESCGHASYVFGAGERNDGVAIAPRQERAILLGHTAAHKRAYVFVIGRRLNMNGPNLRPIEDTIHQPMLQIAERGSVQKIAKRGIVRRALKLRIVHDQFQAGFASRRSKDGSRLKQPIGYWVGEVSALHAFHCRLD